MCTVAVAPSKLQDGKRCIKDTLRGGQRARSNSQERNSATNDEKSGCGEGRIQTILKTCPPNKGKGPLLEDDQVQSVEYRALIE